MYRASSYRLQMFRQCPKRYRFHYIDDLASIYAKPRPYYTMGDHIHAALRDFMSVVPAEQRSQSRLEDLLREKWRRYRKGFSDLDEEKIWGEKALEQMRRFAQSQDLSVNPLMVEDFHKTELTPKITLVGKIDRVDQEDTGSLHIIDYKTGKVPEEQDNTQLYIYALILSREQSLPVTMVSYLYLDTCEYYTVQPTSADLEQATDYVITTVDRILSEREYLATPNMYCGVCDFIEICPRKEEISTLALEDEEQDF